MDKIRALNAMADSIGVMLEAGVDSKENKILSEMSILVSELKRLQGDKPTPLASFSKGYYGRNAQAGPAGGRGPDT